MSDLTLKSLEMAKLGVVLIMDKSKRFIVISIVLLLYFFFVVVPWADSRWFFSTGHSPENNHQVIYFFMVFPFIGLYLALLLWDFKKFKRLRTLLFPLIIFTLFVSFALGMLILGGATMWLTILLVIPVFIAMVVSLGIGAKLDVEESKKL